MVSTFGTAVSTVALPGSRLPLPTTLRKVRPMQVPAPVPAAVAALQLMILVIV